MASFDEQLAAAKEDPKLANVSSVEELHAKLVQPHFFEWVSTRELWASPNRRDPIDTTWK